MFSLVVWSQYPPDCHHRGTHNHASSDSLLRASFSPCKYVFFITLAPLGCIHTLETPSRTCIARFRLHISLTFTAMTALSEFMSGHLPKEVEATQENDPIPEPEKPTPVYVLSCLPFLRMIYCFGVLYIYLTVAFYVFFLLFCVACEPQTKMCVQHAPFSAHTNFLCRTTLNSDLTVTWE